MKRTEALHLISIHTHRAQEFIMRIEGVRGGWYEGKKESMSMVKAVAAIDEAKRAFQNIRDRAEQMPDVPDELVAQAKHHYDALQAAYKNLEKPSFDPPAIDE